MTTAPSASAGKHSGSAHIGIEREATIKARKRCTHALGLVSQHDDERMKSSAERNAASAAHQRLARNR
jgi:hypothetical protein